VGRFTKRFLRHVLAGAKETRHLMALFPNESQVAKAEALAEGLIRMTHPRFPLPKLTAKGKAFVLSLGDS
jgi:hypothetical protein